LQDRSGVLQNAASGCNATKYGGVVLFAGAMDLDLWIAG
jgi:hypothetical protein